jgi:signal transduction histidine kinase/DNA-binding response OmpR family regulator
MKMESSYLPIFETLLKRSPKKKDYSLCMDAVLSKIIHTSGAHMGAVFKIKGDNLYECCNVLQRSLSTPQVSIKYDWSRFYSITHNEGQDDSLGKYKRILLTKSHSNDSPQKHEIRGVLFLFGELIGNTNIISDPVKLLTLILSSSSRSPRSSTEDRLKDRFLATMSHEIRTPLNGIMGMVTMLEDAGPLNEKQLQYVTNLTECVFQLSNLMNNILDFSKMASGHFILAKQPFDIFDVVDDSFKIIEGGALVKGLTLNKKLPPRGSLPKFVGDSQRIQQIFCNLLNNAIKFTEKGCITMKVSTEDILQTNNTVIYVDVQDTGIGIPWDEQPKIFEVFHQSSSLSTYMSRAGTGLGLSIVKELIRLMNGDIKVESSGVNGEGSLFSFHIQLEREINITTISPENIKLFRNAKILVVDDRPEIRLQLTELLSKWGCIPFMASSAEEGLKYIQCGMKFDTVLVDICMPRMSGVEMAQELKGKKYKVPLVGLSSMELVTGEEYFDVYMYKPIQQSQLFSALAKCLKVTSDDRKSEGRFKEKSDVKSEGKDLININYGIIEVTDPTKRRKKARKDLKILIAEDEEHNAFCITEMLHNLGYRKYERVKDGMECLNRVKTSQFDVILMDIIMPNMDGIQATQEIRSYYRMRTSKEKATSPRLMVPYIIAVSAAVMNSSKDKCQFAGVDAYLSKPLTKDKLDAILSPLILTEKSHKLVTKLHTK